MLAEPRSGCPINLAVEALGDRWSLVVLRDVMFLGRRQFRELLLGSREGIASNILSNRLKSLVAAGLLTVESAARGHRGRYSLTEAGIQTLPILVALGSWGIEHRPADPEGRLRAQILRDADPALLADLMDELREIHLDTPRPRPDEPPPSSVLADAYDKTLEHQHET